MTNSADVEEKHEVVEVDGVAEVQDVPGAPPQPPLPAPVDEPPPPVVHGIDENSLAASDGAENVAEDVGDTDDVNIDDSLRVVRASDLAAFIELYVRFQSRIERLGAGRKLKPLRETWESAAADMKRFPNRVDLIAISKKMIEGLGWVVSRGECSL